MAFTHGDQFKPVAGYKTFVNHFHLDFTGRQRIAGFDSQIQDLAAMRALGRETIFFDSSVVTGPLECIWPTSVRSCAIAGAKANTMRQHRPQHRTDGAVLKRLGLCRVFCLIQSLCAVVKWCMTAGNYSTQAAQLVNELAGAQ